MIHHCCLSLFVHRHVRHLNYVMESKVVVDLSVIPALSGVHVSSRTRGTVMTAYRIAALYDSRRISVIRWSKQTCTGKSIICGTEGYAMMMMVCDC